MEDLRLGGAIKRLRKAAGLSQSEFATRIGVAANYVSHLEANRREPSVQLLRKIGAALNVPPGVLLSFVLWADLPAEQKDEYRRIIEILLELATFSQYKKLGSELG